MPVTGNNGKMPYSVNNANILVTGNSTSNTSYREQYKQF